MTTFRTNKPSVFHIPWKRKKKVKPKDIPVNGKLIKFRLLQTLAWGLITGLMFATVIAGFYFGILEVHWYIHIGSFYWSGFDLKPYWDKNGFSPLIVPGFFSAATWPLYRHGLRNLLEPAAATFGVKSLMAKKWIKNDVRLGPVHLVLRVILVLVVAIALVLCGIWALYFGLPSIGINPQAGYFGKYSVGELVLGILVIGQVVHLIWAPAGNTLQGFFTDRSVNKIKAKRKKVRVKKQMGTPHIVGEQKWLPLYVRKPFMPPIVRERICYVLDNKVEVPEHGSGDSGAIIVVALILVLAFALGIIGHYVVGVAGMNVQYLAP